MSKLIHCMLVGRIQCPLGAGPQASAEGCIRLPESSALPLPFWPLWLLAGGLPQLLAAWAPPLHSSQHGSLALRRESKRVPAMKCMVLCKLIPGMVSHRLCCVLSVNSGH